MFGPHAQLPAVQVSAAELPGRFPQVPPPPARPHDRLFNKALLDGRVQRSQGSAPAGDRRTQVCLL